MNQLITRMTFWPQGCDPGERGAHAFAISVVYRGRSARGEHMYSVDLGYGNSSPDEQLSSAGKWQSGIPARNRRFYRFSYERACRLAAAHVDSVVTAGWTYAEWQAHRASQLDDGSL